MRSTLLALLVVLFVAVASANWEGVYPYDDASLWLCQDNRKLWGRMANYGIFQAKRSRSDGTTASGKIFLVGWKQSGFVRESFNKFSGNRGLIQLSYDDSTETLTGNVYAKGSSRSFNFTTTKSSSTVSDRVPQCAIIDTKASSTVQGTWWEQNGTTYSDICLSSSSKGRALARYKDSYTYNVTDSDDDVTVVPGYNRGYCAKKGQVCAGQYTEQSEGMEFGTLLSAHLSDGTLLELWTAGTPGISGYDNDDFSYTLYDRNSNSSDNCTLYQDERFNPAKCRSLELELCNATSAYGFCNVNDEQGQCVRTEANYTGVSLL